MRVLNLVTNADARFFQQQVRALEEAGVTCDVLPVPADHDAASAEGRRSPLDYLRFVPQVLRAADGRYDLVHANYGLTAPAALAQRWLPGPDAGERFPGTAGTASGFAALAGRTGPGAAEREGRAGQGSPLPTVEGRGGLPVVLSLWGSDLLGPVGPVSRRCARACDAVVVMAPHMADELGTDCRVVPHGVDLEKFRPRDRATARAELDWPDDRANVLFPYPPAQGVKNYPVAERVVAAVDRRLDRPVELQTVSGVPHDEMPAYLNAADALLLPSDREGSPNSVKEALACNVPVVATDVGDVRERLAGVEPAAVCEDEADLVEGLADVLERGGRSNGREAAREVSLERMADDLLAVYEDVVPAGEE